MADIAHHHMHYPSHNSLPQKACTASKMAEYDEPISGQEKVNLLNFPRYKWYSTNFQFAFEAWFYFYLILDVLFSNIR